MTDRLTDAQVAALATPCGGRWERFKSYIEIDGATIAPECGEVISALALEVQQSRQRRCGNCAHWDRSGWADDDTGSCKAGHHPCSDADWHCADFTPK